MSKSHAIAELLTGYRRYSSAADLRVGPAADAPATTPVCASAFTSFGVSIAASETISKTVDDGC